MTLGIEELLRAQLEAMLNTSDSNNDERDETTNSSENNIVAKCRQEIGQAARSITEAQELEKYVTRGLRHLRGLHKGDIAEYIGWIEVETACELATAPPRTINYLEKAPPWLSQIVLGGLPGRTPTFGASENGNASTKSFEGTVANWIADLCDLEMRAIGGQPSRAPTQEIAAQALQWKRAYEIPPLPAVCACARFGPKLNSDTRWGAAIRATRAAKTRYDRQQRDIGRDKALVDVEQTLADQVRVEATRFSRVTAGQIRTGAKNELGRVRRKGRPGENASLDRGAMGQGESTSTECRQNKAPRTTQRTQRMDLRRILERWGIDPRRAGEGRDGAKRDHGYKRLLMSIGNEETTYVDGWFTKPRHMASKEQMRIARKIDRKIAQCKGEEQ